MNQKGFSLIELMIVVAIIGILSAMAVPKFQRFQAKARQAEAKSSLSAYYQASQASFAEFSFYPGNFVAIGFRPDGTLNYRVEAQDGSDPSVGPNDNNCVSTATGCAAAYATWTEATPTATSGPANPTTAERTTDSEFEAVAAGRIGSTNIDSWQITHNKALTNENDGLP